MKKKDCYCPECKSLLNLQSGFSPKNKKHTCTECGRIVDVYTGKFPHNDKEDDLYFGDFSVKESKYGEDDSDNEKTAPIPKIPPEALPEEEPPVPDDEDDELPPPPPPPENNSEEADDDDNAGTINDVLSGLDKWKADHVKAIMIAKLGAVLVVLIFIVAFLLAHLLTIGYDSDQLIGQDKRTVAEMLERQGFSRVRTKAVEDLTIADIGEENKVQSIVIGDKDEFSEKNHFLKWKKITIYYRSLQKMKLPISSKDIDDANYNDIVKMFQDAGFVNIITQPLDDLKTGWINSDGEVKEVFVNNKNKFSSDDKYRPDTEIIIVYHTFKQKD